MRKTVIITVISMLIFLSCNKNKKDDNQSNLNMNNSINYVYEDTLYKVYAPLMKDFLKDNNFKFLSNEVFSEKIVDLFGVDVNKSKFDDVAPLINGSNSYIHNVYSIMRKENFIDFYEMDRGIIDGGGDALKDYLTVKRNRDDTFIIYNKLLLNDDISTFSYILNDNINLENIVVYFNYEKNKILNDALVKSIKNIKDSPDSFKIYLLWYNNLNKTEVIRKKIIFDILEKNQDYIFNLTYFLFENNNNVVPKQYEKFINQTLAYLIEIQLKKDENNDANNNKGYSLLNNFYVQNKLILNDFQTNSFYNYPLLKKYTELYLSLAVENETDYAIIQDKDGYTNLRKEKNTTSQIIQKINTGEKVEILESRDSNWYYVKTSKGNEGYVNKSRLKF